MSASASTSPFAQPGAPPPPVVIFLDFTDLYFPPAVSLLAFEDLPSDFSVDAAADRSRSTHSRFHPYRREASSASSASHSASKDAPRQTTNDDFHRADSSPLSSPASSPRSSPPAPSNKHRRPTIVSERIKIERPTGAGRRNLQSQVHWEKTLLSDMKKYARVLIRDHLNSALCFKDQNEAKMKHVRKEVLSSSPLPCSNVGLQCKYQMSAKFPILDNYVNMWPLDVIVMGLLKYSSSHTKETSTKQNMNIVRDVIGPVSSVSSRTRRSKAV
ncbi:hypothetical protein Hypma_001402 [Hypsizygus marmoreus]|uniref:Uncharacterized protein n=1 Tax=Hypsizygus marmoreus TaxID=39966 RepID=A0A369KB23_HYPMA|nr:hypothetical protein Hypma_001402 [Hypsizygus marmoreus]